MWINHLRRDNPPLTRLLEDGRVWSHEFVIGELACGKLRRRSEILFYLNKLPCVPTARHTDVTELVNARRLFGRGIGWVDAHLLASAVLEGLSLWSFDRALTGVAKRLAITVDPP